MNDREARAKLLDEIRRVDALATAEWLRGLDPATRVPILSVREAGSSTVQDIATLRPGISFDDEQMLIKGRAWIRFLLSMLDTAFDHIRAQNMEIRNLERKAAGKEPPNYAAECAMASQQNDFRLWLIDQHGMDPSADADRIKTRVRTMLQINSRAELNTNPAAASRWQRMKKDFETWKARK
ncbi:hypothetical protein G6L14_02030 [Agrobacterium vitis]|uniref:hypothetical protein n=1 Tax=Agrobacterium vitis TaxID=373 RepID=UPI0015745EFB|nr:hypothetical protein [Agrobacterium vitis]NSY10793.1 hypothetical protein [Agrobacterium vitis]